MGSGDLTNAVCYVVSVDYGDFTDWFCTAMVCEDYIAIRNNMANCLLFVI